MRQKLVLKEKSFKILFIMIIMLCGLWITHGRVWMPAIVVSYEQAEKDDYAQIFWNVGEGMSENSSRHQYIADNETQLSLPSNIEYCSEIRFDPTAQGNTVVINQITVKSGPFEIGQLDVDESFKDAKLENVSAIEVSDSRVFIEPETEDVQCYWSEETIGDIKNIFMNNRPVNWIIAATLIAIGLLAVLYIFYEDKVYNKIQRLQYSQKEKWRFALAIMCITAFLLVFFMALCSRDEAHPDEIAVSGTIDYYINHWFPGDIREADAAGTYSNYGSSRLKELTFYYFFAGKVAWFARNVLHILMDYRVFNIILFAILVFLFIKKGNKNNWMYVVIGITPQLWYLFSYGTSDAWDYFLSVLVMYQIINADSLLNKALKESSWKKCMVPLLLNGTVCGLLLLGKQTFYIVFVMAFIILVGRWIRAEKTDRKQLFLKYLCIAMICLTVFGARWGYDYARYDGEKKMVISKQAQVFADDEYKSGQDLDDMFYGKYLQKRGVSLSDLFSEYHFGKMTFQSFTGYYGWMEYPGGNIYYILIGILYLTLYIVLVYYFIREKVRWKQIEFVLLTGCMLFSFALSAYHSWTSDFQPQGRYLFPILLALGYLVSQQEQYFENRVVRVSLYAVFVLSIYSFLFVGFVNLI